MRDITSLEKRKLLSIFGGSLALASVSQLVPFFNLAKPGYFKKKTLDLKGFVSKDGSITPFKHGSYTDIYFGTYALCLADRFGFDVQNLADGFLKWSAPYQSREGYFTRLCRATPEAGGWHDCGRSDSHDATLARWLELYYRTDSQNKGAHLGSVAAKSLEALMRLKRDNGTFGVFPSTEKGYEKYSLFKDNIEVHSFFEYMAQKNVTSVNLIWPDFSQERSKLRESILKNFGTKPNKLTRLALGANYDKDTFYPHGVAGPFAVLEGFFTPDAFDWDSWLIGYKKKWGEQAATDYPWGLVALAAWVSGREDIAVDWMHKYYDRGARSPKKGVRWNILEEVCAQILATNLTTK